VEGDHASLISDNDVFAQVTSRFALGYHNASCSPCFSV
jgi:hypothetical protein